MEKYQGEYRYMRLHGVAMAVSLLVISLLSPVCVKAETVSQKQAASIARAFFNEMYGEEVGAPKMVWNGRQLTTDRLFAPFYIYNQPRGGFVIIAADSKAYPILGYSRTSKFDREKLSDQANDILKRYAREIEIIRYDSRVPDRAVAAWQNLPLYINKTLHNPYDTPEFVALTDAQRERLEAVDRNLSAIMLPQAVEFEVYNPDRYRDYTIDDVLGEETEGVPFSFYEDFIKLINEEQASRLAALEEVLSPTKPVVEPLGGAHFAIRFPVEVKMAVVYSLQGMRLIERNYKNTDTINIDLSTLPGGFYPMLALGSDGRVYGFKLYR